MGTESIQTLCILLRKQNLSFLEVITAHTTCIMYVHHVLLMRNRREDESECPVSINTSTHMLNSPHFFSC